MLGRAPGAKEIVSPTANASDLKKPPGTTVVDGAVAIDAAAAGGTEETVTTGKDLSGLICYAFTHIRVCVYT